MKTPYFRALTIAGSDNSGGAGFTMAGIFFYKLAEYMKKDIKYTLQDINNMVFKKSGSGSSQIGWGAYWIVQALSLIHI